MKSQVAADLTIAEQAANWLLEIEEPGPNTFAEFSAWLKASPVHVQEFLLATNVWKAFDGFDAERRIKLDRVLEELRGTVRELEPAVTVPPAAGGSSQRATRRSRWSWAGVALAATVLAAWAAMTLMSGASRTYATSTGEQRAFKLEDGSIVHLNTQSRVAVRFSQSSRTVQLLEGEALFTVERDPQRPFRVVSQDVVIQAIGTQFNVYRQAEGTTVAVIEGVVQIEPERTPQSAARGKVDETAREIAASPVAPLAVHAARLTAGEQARVFRNGRIDKQAVPDREQVVAWQQRRLVFRGDSLEVVAREFNRYNELQIALESPDIGSKRLTGVFDADDPESLVLFLSKDADLAIETDPSTVHIRRR